MVVAQREILDVNLSAKSLYADELFYDSAVDLLNRSHTLRPYPAVIFRGGAGEEELTDMVERGVGKQSVIAGNSPLRTASFLSPVNQAMHDYWEVNRADPRLEVVDLSFVQRVLGEGQPAHIDQKYTEEDDMPQAGLLAALVILKGEVDYGFKATNKDVFEPKDRSFFAGTDKSRPQGMRYPHPFAKPGDVLLFTTNTIHFSKARKKERSVAAYLSRFRLSNPVE